jgi:DNA-binding NarL/FixJ family response regulator
MPSILIVEDNDFFRTSFKEIMRMYMPFLSVEESCDGKDVFAKIAKNFPDMIFMDIGLPGKTGLELTREIKSDYPDLVISVFTSNDTPEYRKIARECGADYFFKKDALTGAQIADILEKVIKGKKEKMGATESKKSLGKKTEGSD